MGFRQPASSAGTAGEGREARDHLLLAEEEREEERDRKGEKGGN